MVEEQMSQESKRSTGQGFVGSRKKIGAGGAYYRGYQIAFEARKSRQFTNGSVLSSKTQPLFPVPQRRLHAVKFCKSETGLQ